MNRFDNRTVLITGGSTGIGRATALAFAREGASVVLADVAEAEARKTLALLQEHSPSSVFINTDVTNAEQVRTLVRQTVETFGTLHCAVNNAGIEGSNIHATHEYDDAVFRRVMEVNVMGVFYCMKAELQAMLAHKTPGAIVNTASIAGLNGFPFHAAYSASKFAVVSLTKTAALEYARRGIRINAICPGFTQTPMLEEAQASLPKAAMDKTLGAIPMRRVATPEEIAEGILYLCSDAASYTTGHTLVLDGGLTAAV
jgi:NAD(P)-dependent dehydrogenase (short-subunit alcohol dehydrogenase family)